MKRLSPYLFSLLLFTVFNELKAQKPKADRQKAKESFEYLNKVRANPATFSKSLGVNLSKVEKRKALVWNDTLAKVAEAKAMDMAKRGYFGHVSPDGEGINIMIHRAGYKLPDSWVKNKADNYFESIGAGTPTGEDLINMLIVDENEPTLGHRKHLLGIDKWNEELTDIGIGFIHAPETPYGYYISIIIAKKQ